MSATACALMGFVVWSIVLTLVLLVVRGGAMRTGKAPNSFAADGTDIGPLGLRVTRAHANSLENLAIIASLLLYAIATNQTAITDGLATVALGARVVQSVVHMVSTSIPAILVRATAFTVQMVIALMWAWGFWHAA